MEYAPRGFDRVVQVFFLICCLPCVYGEGGFCWQWGADSQSCSTVCTNAGLLCVKKFDKVGSEAAFQEAGGGVACNGYGGQSYSGYPGKKSNGDCVYQTGSDGDCTTFLPSGSPTDVARLCSCQCAAGTFSNSDLKPDRCEE